MTNHSFRPNDLPLTSDEKDTQKGFDEEGTIHNLKHYLPAQAPLKDFIHHNTLHAFQSENFLTAILKAKVIFGYNTLLSMEEYQELYRQGRIRADVLERIILQKKGSHLISEWLEKLFGGSPKTNSPRVGRLRSKFRELYALDLDAQVHPILFRVISSFLDQGIAMWNFPIWNEGFLASLRELERQSFTSFFRTSRPKELLQRSDLTITSLLKILVGDDRLYEQYLFDQQFAHQGWSGIVSAIEDNPTTLLDQRKISLRELIIFELLLEIDALDHQLGNSWSPLTEKTGAEPEDLFRPTDLSEDEELLQLWQEAFEWSYYDQVLAGICLEKTEPKERNTARTFQAMFCIDDRECSLRRYLENNDPACETFGTPGFFSVEFFYKPEHGKFYTKLCPAPVTPKFLIKEEGSTNKHHRDAHFSKHSHSLIRGWLITYTLGFWSAFKLFANIFRPSVTPATATSFRHMDEFSSLSIENKGEHQFENGLQIGFTIAQMADRVENLLRSIGLINNFAPLVYVVGHGSSSVNNPHYAAYDCGACSGRPGSVNARVISAMANHADVRTELIKRSIIIPDATQFIGALHDTTRDEVTFYDTDKLSPDNAGHHARSQKTFQTSLKQNAKERSRRFDNINSKRSLQSVHSRVKERSVSLFEPRPELNHATNALCIIGRREISSGLFLDRRSFLNSYDYRTDPDGKYLFGILKAAAPVCGGINLEYFFSRVDNKNLGAGTKLPHNVMGLFGVANGTDGDLRPGLPSQMIEVHDPVRLLIIVEQFPEVVASVIQQDRNTLEWFYNEWVHLVSVNPETKELMRYKNGFFIPYQPLQKDLERVSDLTPLLESEKENFPVYLIS